MNPIFLNLMLLGTLITQGPDSWLKPSLNGVTQIQDIQISDGGLLNWAANPKPTDSIVLKNVSNIKGGKKYFVMIWPPMDAKGHQQALPSLKWDGGVVHQGIYEAAFRGKIDDAQIQNVTFIGSMDSKGHPIKQVVQIRHGKSWSFKNCTFQNSYPDIGQQKTAQPDGSSHYETSQHVGTVTFENCAFKKWNGSMVFSRQPGVDHIVFKNCKDPSGKTFSKTY